MPVERVDTDSRLLRPTALAALPFLLVVLLAVVTVLLPPYAERSGAMLLALPLLLVSFGLQAVAVRRPSRTWVDPLGAWSFYLPLALLLHGTGGAASGLAPLIALPVLWLALFGTRRDLWVAAVLTLAIVPLLLVGGSTFPDSVWRRAVLWLAITGLVAPAVQRLVGRLSAATGREREASAQVRALLRGATLCSIVGTDVTGTITSFSQGSVTLVGYAPDDLVGVSSYAVLHAPDEIAAAAAELGVDPGFAVFAELARRGAASRIWRYVREDGQPRSVYLAMTEVRDDAGVLSGYLGVAIDATTDLAIRAALAASEERFRAVIDNLPDTSVLVLDDALDIHLSTGGGGSRLGFDDVSGRNLREVSKPENVAQIVQLLDEAWAGGTARADLLSTGAGTELEVVVRALPVSSLEDRQSVLVARDVSQDRAQRRAVAEARDRAERLFADAPQGVTVLDRDGRVLRANAALLRLADCRAEDVVGRPLRDLGAEHEHTLDDHLREVLASSAGRAQTDWTMRTASGTTIFVALSSTALRPVDPRPDHDDGETEVLVNLTDVTERHRHAEQLAHLADHDTLTGLANRRRFTNELTQHLEYCRRYGARGAVLLLDLDHFKHVNDTLGHSAGDHLMVSVAAVIRDSVRASDLVARLGGDEFALLLREGERHGAETVASTLVDRIRQLGAALGSTVGVVATDGRSVTASVGLVVVEARSRGPAEILAAADLAMYEAKEAGRDQWASLERRPDPSRTGARLARAARLEAALARDQLVLHLEPVWDVARHHVTGAEALLRLVDGPDLVAPDRFLDVAERSDLTMRIDAWVVDHTIGLLARLQRVDPAFSLEVAVSGRSVATGHLEDVVVEALARHGADPSGLVVGLRETADVADVAAARDLAERVTALGCRFSLHDFGTGPGSFLHLRHLPVDVVKISSEVVSSCHLNPTDRAILRSIVGVARDLGKLTVAGSCSEQAVLDVVAAEGVDRAQGQHLGQPLALEDFLETHLRAPAEASLVTAKPSVDRPQSSPNGQ